MTEGSLKEKKKIYNRPEFTSITLSEKEYLVSPELFWVILFLQWMAKKEDKIK